jgi:hypothetical protein
VAAANRGTLKAQAQFLRLTSVKFGTLFPFMRENSLVRYSAAQLKRAVAVKEKIEELEKELTGLLGIPEPMTVGGIVRRHRKMSAAARKKISAGAKARWAKMRSKDARPQ